MPSSMSNHVHPVVHSNWLPGTILFIRPSDKLQTWCWWPRHPMSTKNAADDHHRILLVKNFPLLHRKEIKSAKPTRSCLWKYFKSDFQVVQHNCIFSFLKGNLKKASARYPPTVYNIYFLHKGQWKTECTCNRSHKNIWSLLGYPVSHTWICFFVPQIPYQIVVCRKSCQNCYQSAQGPSFLHCLSDLVITQCRSTIFMRMFCLVHLAFFFHTSLTTRYAPPQGRFLARPVTPYWLQQVIVVIFYTCGTTRENNTRKYRIVLARAT